MALDAGTPEATEAPIEQPSEPLAEATPEVVDAPVETPETPTETPRAEAAPEAVTTEEAPAEEAPKEAPEAEAAPEPVTFDTTAELPDLKAKITEVLDKYELPAEVQAAFDALHAKAESIIPPDTRIVSELADYGEPAIIKSALERDALLSSVTEMPNGEFRPNTDKFVADLVQRATPEVVEHLYFDLANTPSQKYPGVLRFEEGIVDALALPGDTVGSVLSRYQEMVTFAKSGAIPVADVPEYIREQQLDAAYKSLPKEVREEFDTYSTEFDPENQYAVTRNGKLAELRQIQKGIDADQREHQRLIQDHQQKLQQQNQRVYQTQRSFFDGMRDAFTETLVKEAVFPTALAARQNVTLLMQAFADDSDGVYARTALEQDGIKFDFNKARELVSAVERASFELTNAKSTVDANGRQLNDVALRRATRQFEEVGRQWQEFGADILRQEQRLTTTGTAKAVEKEVAKIKIAPKARAVPKGVATPAAKKEPTSLYRNYNAYVDAELESERKRAQPYAA